MTKTGAHRSSESEIAIGVLQIVRDSGGEASIARIKESILDYVELTVADKAVSQMRPREPLYAQIIDDIVSHHATAGNIIFEGYAVYDEYRNVLSITNAGRAYLENKDYEESRAL